MVIYGVEHFIYAPFVFTIVPPWIPWHAFWTYFTGIALIAAGVSIVFKKYAHLAATLLGTMIFLWVVLIHVFLIFHKPDDLWAGRSMFGDLPGRLNNAFKDLGLSGAAFILAGTQSEAARTLRANKLFRFGRLLFCIAIAAFGALHFLYPAFAPGIPPMFTDISFLLPGHLVWVYFTGATLFAAAICILMKKEERLVAMSLGAMIVVFDLLTWVPRFGAHPGDITGNWLKDLGLAGGALVLASALPKELRGAETEVFEVAGTAR